MASPLQIAAGGWGFLVMGWMLSPILSFLVNNFFTNLSLDTSRKLRKLEIDTIPSLKETLRKVVEQRMLGEVKGKGSESDLATLRKIEDDLRSALYEAEDIPDLVDYHRIEKKVKGDGPSWISSTAGACITRCKGAWLFRRCIERIRSALLLCAKGFSWLGATLCRSGEQIPVSQGPSSSIPVVQRLRAWSQSLDIKALCQSMQSWLAETYVAACCYRDWSYEAVGINKTNKMDYSFLSIILRIKLRKRIEHIEYILDDSKKSPLLNQQSSSSSAIPEESRRMQEEVTNLHRRIDREVFGRDEERERICSMLRKGSDADGPTSSSSKPYSVFGIHGITGSGKTTLAQYVCDHEKEAKDKHFDPVMFIHVSETFRIDKIFCDMLSEMGQRSDSNSVTALNDDLKKKLKGKRFLLVLDDLWVNDENQKERDVLLDALNGGQCGSRILVTAQKEDAAAALGAREQKPIPDLEEEQYFRMFTHYALEDINSDHDRYTDHDRYISIGRKISKKLLKSPMAAKTVAARLQGRSISFWERTANDDVLNETLGPLWWSYQHLGADIKRCFAYCSTFPKGYEVERDELVRIWIAQGFVNPSSHATEELEDVGNRYIDELLTFSFLQVRDTEVLTIHDLLHKLAEMVAGSDFHRINLNGPQKDILAGVHHVFFETDNVAKVVMEKSLDLEKLRTLIIKEHYTEDTNTTQRTADDLEKVFDCLFKRLRELRVLIIDLKHRRERRVPIVDLKRRMELLLGRKLLMSLPASVDRMKHLRCLGFRFYRPRRMRLILPSTFSKLYHMQTIDFDQSCRVVSWPQDMANLIHLRHVTCASLPFPNVGRLTSLQTPAEFYVKKKQGYELKQLKHLNKLKGALKIFDLDIVRSKEEALEAQLARKERLTKLALIFGSGYLRSSRHLWWRSPYTCNDPGVAAEVLEGLCPPKDLVELEIYGYKGSRYPSWMLSRQHPDAPKCLQKLELYCCIRLASIPEDNELFTQLRELCISNCDWDRLPENMERLVSLGKIRIFHCRVLSTTCKEEGHENWHKIQHIPKKVIDYEVIF